MTIVIVRYTQWTGDVSKKGRSHISKLVDLCRVLLYISYDIGD